MTSSSNAYTPPPKKVKSMCFFLHFLHNRIVPCWMLLISVYEKKKKIIILASDTVRLGNTATVEKVVQSQGWLLKLLCKAITLKVCSTSKAGLIFNCSSCLMHLQSIKNVKLVFLLSSESINKLLLGKHLDECVWTLWRILRGEATIKTKRNSRAEYFGPLLI